MCRCRMTTASVRRPFSPPERPEIAREDLVAAEREAREVGAHRLFGLVGVLVPDRVDRPPRRIEIGELLVVVADRDVVAGRDAARERREAAGERLQEGRLAGAVLAQDRHPLAAQELEGHVAHDRRRPS